MGLEKITTTEGDIYYIDTKTGERIKTPKDDKRSELGKEKEKEIKIESINLRQLIFSFKGRINRSVSFLYVFLILIFIFAPLIISTKSTIIEFHGIGIIIYPVFAILLSLLLLIPAIIKRLHDININGTWVVLFIALLLLYFIFIEINLSLLFAIIFLIISIVLFLIPGNVNKNKYGLLTKYYFSKNDFKYLLILLLVIFSVTKICTFTNSTIADNFAIEDVSTVTKIFMSDKLNNKVTLEKVEEQNWKLNNKYEASRQEVNMLLETMNELKVKEPVSKAGRNNVIKWLAAKNTKVEIYQSVYRINLFDKIKLFKHEKLTKVYYVGNETQDNIGTFMLLEGEKDPSVVYIPGFRGFVSPRFSAVESDWRAHTVFDLKISDIKSVRLVVPNYPDSSFEITREGRNFQLKLLASNRIVNEYDTMKVLDYMSSFININFETFRNSMGKHVIDSITSQKPLHILTVTDITGKERTVITFPKPADEGQVDDINDLQRQLDLDRFYALVNDKKDFVTIQFFVFEHLIRSADYFRRVINNK